MRRIGGILQAALRLFIDHDGPVSAGHMTFMSLLSIFPFLIFLVAIAGFLGQTETGTHFVAFLLEILPTEVSDTFQRPMLEILQETRGGLLTIGILTSIWTSSSGLEAVRFALDRTYDVEERRPFWYRRIQAVFLVVMASIFIILAMLALVFGPILWETISQLLDFIVPGGLALPDIFRLVFNLVRYGFGFILILFVVSTLYYILPSVALKVRWVLPGALLVVLLWIASATLFSLFVNQVGDYTVTYGSLAGVILALLFIYVLSLIFIFGAEVNAAIRRLDEAALSSGHQQP